MWWVARGNVADYLQLQTRPLPDAIKGGADLMLGGVMSLCAVFVVFALIDLPVQTFVFMREQRMTKREVKEEHKTSEGRPEIKQRIRQIQQKMSRGAVRKAVPTADVVIVNPEHYAVAVKYDEKRAQAPFVIAKGVDEMALFIKALAIEHDVEVVTLPPLARAIYNTSQVNQQIPAALCEAVASVLAYVLQIQAFRKGRRNALPALPSDLSFPRFEGVAVHERRTADNFLSRTVQALRQHRAAVPIFLMALLAMIILPLPPVLLDVLFTFNIVLALIVVLVSVTSRRPLDFSIFPTVILATTLMRLALNVASTRVVLLHGHEGTHAAGSVIEAFGHVVIGGNFVVGLVVFVILMIINFAVVTKGAERISEVSARFTLDALPGKQMAIDADLNAGLINQEKAQQRRREVAMEADFYGAMDGASKFVRGDAIAGILVLLINMVGGVIIGSLMHDLSFGEAFKLYALLTIGDGLVAQIPALLLSAAAAIIVTRISDSGDFEQQVGSQMLASPSVLWGAAAMMLVLGLIPGMPWLTFLVVRCRAGVRRVAHDQTSGREARYE